MKTVPEMLRDAAKIYEDRNKLYGDNYLNIGHAFKGMFPKGIVLQSPDDFNRFALIVQSLGKLTRYAAQFYQGGHEDSLVDLSVYSQMLAEVDEGVRERQWAFDAALDLSQPVAEKVEEENVAAELFVPSPPDPSKTEEWAQMYREAAAEGKVVDPFAEADKEARRSKLKVRIENSTKTPKEKIQNLQNFMVEDILAMTDEEVLDEYGNSTDPMPMPNVLKTWNEKGE